LELGFWDLELRNRGFAPGSHVTASLALDS
jgi:hypothetical protein